MSSENGKAKKISTRLEDSGTEDQSYCLGETREESCVDGINPVELDRENRNGRNPTGRSDSGVTDFGKLRERLELVKNSHIDYVRAHQARLEARLEDSKKLEAAFNQRISELEEELLRLTSNNAVTANGNGHN